MCRRGMGTWQAYAHSSADAGGSGRAWTVARPVPVNTEMYCSQYRPSPLTVSSSACTMSLKYGDMGDVPPCSLNPAANWLMA